jgi:hypothetical protein
VLASEIGILHREARHVAAGPRQTRNEACPERIRCCSEDDRYDRCRLLCRDDHWVGIRDDDIDLEPNQLGGELGGAVAASLRPAILDRKVTPLNPAEFAQPLQKSGDPLTLHRRRA